MRVLEERSEKLSQIYRNRRKRKQNETSEERAARVHKTAAKKARVSRLSEEESILRQQRQREQTRLRFQALRRKRQQIAICCGT